MDRAFAVDRRVNLSMLEHRRAAQILADQENHTECELGPWKTGCMKSACLDTNLHEFSNSKCVSVEDLYNQVHIFQDQ